MTITLHPDTIVQLVKPGHTGGESSPARCLTAGETVIYKGQRMRVLATNKHSGKAIVEPVDSKGKSNAQL